MYASILICPKQYAWNSPRVTLKWANQNHNLIQRPQLHILHWCTHLLLDVSTFYVTLYLSLSLFLYLYLSPFHLTPLSHLCVSVRYCSKNLSKIYHLPSIRHTLKTIKCAHFWTFTHSTSFARLTDSERMSTQKRMWVPFMSAECKSERVAVIMRDPSFQSMPSFPKLCFNLSTCINFWGTYKNGHSNYLKQLHHHQPRPVAVAFHCPFYKCKMHSNILQINCKNNHQQHPLTVILSLLKSTRRDRKSVV